MTGYEGLYVNAAWIDLSTRGKIRVSGEDRARFLHAMSTNHVQGLQAGDGLYAFFLTAQGRILADAYIYNLGDAFLLDTEPETAGKLLQHLDSFLIADDAMLENETDAWALIGIEGPNAIEYLAEHEIQVPEKQFSIRKWRDGWIARTASTGPEGARVFLPRGQEDEFLKKLDLPQATEAEARLVRLENGLPRYGDDISERYLVQETQQLHAVHTSKGCYLGQEIVERVRSRGQVHRLLCPVRIKDTVAPPPGTKLRADSKDVAEITSAEYSQTLGEVVALAYVRTEALHAKPDMAVADSHPPIRAYIP
jgi:aminomethyltransferase